MNNHKKTTLFLFLALLVVGAFTISPAAQASEASGAGSEEVSNLLSKVKDEVRLLERDAADLDSFVRSKLSWQSHADKITQMKDHINHAGELLAQLHDERAAASPWQQEAIDRISPLLKELADNTTATIAHLNDNQSNIHVSPALREYADKHYQVARELAALVTDFVNYEEHEAEFRRLQEKLQLAER